MEAWLTRHHSNSFSLTTFQSIHHFQIDHSAPCSQSNILHNHCFQFLMGISAVPREIEEIWEGGWGEANKVHYGLCGNGKMVNEMNPFPFVTRNLKFRYYNSTKLLRTFLLNRFQLSEAWAFFFIWGFRNVKENFSNVFYISSLGIARSTERSSFFTSIRLNSQSWIPATYWITRKTWWDISKRKQLGTCDFNIESGYCLCTGLQIQ